MIQDIIEAQKNNPQLQNTINIQELLQTNESVSYMQNKSLESFAEEIFELLKEEYGEQYPEFVKNALYKLKDYRFVENICDLHKGKHIRWIRMHKYPSLTNGGLVMDIKFTQTGIQILAKSKTNRFMQVKYDDCLFFQKLSEDELAILGLQELALSSS